MDLPNPELTEIALGIMGYQMYDHNGAPTDSFSQLMQPPDSLETGVAAAANQRQPSCTNRDTQRDEEQFMAEFGISDAATVLEEPDQYVKGQMVALLELLEERILQTKAMSCFSNKAKGELREKNATANEEEIEYFCIKLGRVLTKAERALQAEIGVTWSKADQSKSGDEAKLVERLGEQLEEFKMLLDLLKIILDETPDDWRELDIIQNLLKMAIDMM